MLAAGLSLTVRPCDQPVLAVDHESEVVVGNDPGRSEPDSRIRLQIECHAEKHRGRALVSERAWRPVRRPASRCAERSGTNSFGVGNGFRFGCGAVAGSPAALKLPGIHSWSTRRSSVDRQRLPLVMICRAKVSGCIDKGADGAQGRGKMVDPEHRSPLHPD